MYVGVADAIIYTTFYQQQPHQYFNLIIFNEISLI